MKIFDVSKCIGQMYMFLCGIMIDYELFMEILYRCFFVCFSVLYEVFGCLVGYCLKGVR